MVGSRVMQGTEICCHWRVRMIRLTIIFCLRCDCGLRREKRLVRQDRLKRFAEIGLFFLQDQFLHIQFFFCRVDEGIAFDVVDEGFVEEGDYVLII